MVKMIIAMLVIIIIITTYVTVLSDRKLSLKEYDKISEYNDLEIEIQKI